MPIPIPVSIIKYSFLGGILLTLLHYLAWGVTWGEGLIERRFNATSEALVAALARDFGYTRPDPQTAKDLFTIASEEALKANLNPGLVKALIHVESAGELFAISPKGALGPMQVMPQNAKFCGLKVAELFDERKNVKCGIKILKQGLAENGGDLGRALQAYNGGQKCVGKCRESINHSQLVMRRLVREY